MFDLFYLLLLLVPAFFLAGLLILLKRQLKVKLVQSGKFTKRRNILLNILFTSILALSTIWWNYTLNDRTPGNKIIERVTKIPLPEDIIVIKDEYHDYFPDYSIECVIQFTEKDTKTYIRAIRNNPLYDALYVDDNDPKHINDSKIGTWCKTKNGYHFSKLDRSYDDNIFFDTVNRKLYYLGGSW
jgi:hypothetical protein